MTDHIFIIFLYSKTCGIRTQDSFVITGGIDDSTPDWDWGSKTVSRYGSFGQIDRLPMLNVGKMKKERVYHAVAVLEDVSQICS